MLQETDVRHVNDAIDLLGNACGWKKRRSLRIREGLQTVTPSWHPSWHSEGEGKEGGLGKKMSDCCIVAQKC
jgi:hypothetical protein